MRIGSDRLGAALCVAALLLVGLGRPLAAACGLELLALAFWCWARAAQDRDEQLPRWSWLRRPAIALWLAAGCGAVLGALPVASGTRSPAEALQWAQAGGIVWAGLELLAALPLERPYSDRPGPLLSVGPWLPIVLPAAGFLVLWRQAERWTNGLEVRDVTLFLLSLTAALAALRAFSRRRWTATLRWLVVADSSLAAMLVALQVVRAEVALMLWLAAFGGRAALLAGELRGAAPRRRPLLFRLWRTTGWVTTAALACPLLAALAFGPTATRHASYAIVVAAASTLMAWVSVRRLVEAPERRAVVRRESAVSLSQLAALLCLTIGPGALALAWWTGFGVEGPAVAVALLPAALGGGAAWWLEARLVAVARPGAAAFGGFARRLAHGVFRAVIGIERPIVRLVAAIGRLLLVPSRDLHTGDAQEYLLFLVGLSVLALVLPLLQ
jgi:hypothetical protein